MLLQTNPEFQKLYDFSEKLRDEIYRETVGFQEFLGDDKAELPYDTLLRIIFNRVMENKCWLNKEFSKLIIILSTS